MENLKIYSEEIMGLSAEEIVVWAIKTFKPDKIVLASSFSAEDQVLTNMLLNANRNGRIFTLDTGRNFQETYDVWQKSIEYWKVNYEIGAPESDDLQDLYNRGGPNLFYNGVDNRKYCCTVRKAKPLQKILSTVDGWIVGLRSEQSITRSGLLPIEWDSAHNIYRISPLYNWSEAQVFSYILEHKLPLSELYGKGFRSIGCEPCSRAIEPNDDIRSGRWWWEEPEHKECGIHNRKNK